MAYNTQEQSSNQARRYTISYLLQLAPSKENSFDLSKFTYDAARAGVVPCLGDCAVSLRRTSGNRPRNRSIGTTDATDDGAIHFVESIEAKRQPANPPLEARAQKDRGFARFLEKHSSPTHNRVTAGGRIVPMEKRESPPKFTLSAQHNFNRHDVPNRNHQDKIHTGLAALNTTTMPELAGSSPGLEHMQPSFPTDRCFLQSSADSDLKSSNINYANAYNGVTFCQPIAISSVQPFLSPPMMMSNLHPGLQANDNFTYNSGCFVPPTPAYSHQSLAPIAPCFMPYTDSYTPSFTGNSVVDAQIQLLHSSQQAFAQAEAHYNELDKQLKAIDRHRAMSAHDPEMTSQRMAIVQQRASARETMSILENHLVQVKHLQPLSINPATSFNVQAQAYVPQPALFNESEPANNLTSYSGHSTGNIGFPPGGSGQKRKIIPIVPPPTKLSAQADAKVQEKTNTSPTSSCKPETDNWKTTSGHASFRDANLQGMTPKSPMKSSQNTPENAHHHISPKIIPEPEDSTSSVSFNQMHFNNGTMDDEFAECSDWLESNPGRAPPYVEAEYERQLDALRQEEGVQTIVERADGSYMTVMGRNLQRPQSADMDVFEKEYWNRVSCVAADTKAFSTFESGNTSSASNNGNRPRVSENKHPQAASCEETVGRHTYGNLEWDHAVLTLSPVEMDPNSNDTAAGVPIGRNRFHTKLQSMANQYNLSIRPENGDKYGIDNIASDPFDNKSYSSVSVQNVHAVMDPSRSDEAATKITRRSVQSLLAAAMNQRSPRLLHRSTPNGGAWYGPYRREFHSTGPFEEED